MKKIFIVLCALLVGAEITARVFYKQRRAPEPFSGVAGPAQFDNEVVIDLPKMRPPGQFIIVTGGSAALAIWFIKRPFRHEEASA